MDHHHYPSLPSPNLPFPIQNGSDIVGIPAQLQNPSSSNSEDAAGEGGDAVDTFSAYHPPKWVCDLVLECNAANTVCDIHTHNVNVDNSNNNNYDCISIVDVENDHGFSRNNVDKCIEGNNSSHKNIEPHSSPACESGLLASVSAPKPNEECLVIVRDMVREGRLSALQVEGVALAIQRHCHLLPASDGSFSNNQGTAKRRVRAGFFIGDGAGIGKGRQISAILRDSFSRSTRGSEPFSSPSNSYTPRHSNKKLPSRRRHLWLSVSRELIEDARRDLHDVGCFVPVLDGVDELTGNIKGFSTKNEKSAVLFATYPFLVSGKGRRLEDIISWLVQFSDNDGKKLKGNSQISKKDREESFDGCIIFDEAHKAKNLCADPPTITGQLVLALQERLPNARVLYCSATGVSDLNQMAYAVRLGLWGAGTNFGSFQNFHSTLQKRGVGAMEMLALEMKQAGCFVARTLSWDGAEFNSVEVSLSPEQVDIYDQSMIWWNRVMREIKNALSSPDMGGTPKMLWSHYWSAHQRFSREIAICAKIPLVVEDALKQLKNDKCVVIGLQSTGEASTLASLDDLKSKLATQNFSLEPNVEDIVLPSLLSTSGAIMSSFVRNHFPIACLPPQIPKVPPMPPGGFTSEYERTVYQQMITTAERIRNLPAPKPKPELIRKRQELLDAIDEIELPPSPLDDLIDRLGGIDVVAEMTGRSGRVIRIKGTNAFKFTKRISGTATESYGLSMPTSEDEFERLNIIEKKKFMEGCKRVAIISDAASTGISLHAASGSLARDKRRVHYTIELPWAADKAIQQLGRTHRSGQITAPIYKMVVTELGGERRFAAAVAKRMASLGALTKGDRRAATGGDLSEFDIDSRFGRRALLRLYDCMRADPPYTPSKGANSVLDLYISTLQDPSLLGKTENERRLRGLEDAKLCLEIIGIGINSDLRKNAEVKLFLNRIAALAVSKQNLLFHLFATAMDDVITEAKATGEFEGSVEDVRATSIEYSSTPETITSDLSSGALTKLAKFNIDRGCSLSRLTNLILDLVPSSHSTLLEPTSSVAKSGIYISKRQFAGRTLVLFARRKVQLSTSDDEIEGTNLIDYDPMGLMILTRPNTGTNPFEMPTADLQQKYKLVASLDDLSILLQSRHVEGKTTAEVLVELMTNEYPSFVDLWTKTFQESNKLQSEVGLAPRLSRIGIITGAVLHCLPALEKALEMRRLSERSLKVIRVEVTSNGSRIVGFRVPVDDEALESIRATLNTLQQARSGISSYDLVSFEKPGEIQQKNVMWLTSPPKTMLNYFSKSSSSSSSHNTNGGEPPLSILNTNKRLPTRTESRTKKSKTSSITSFFKKI